MKRKATMIPLAIVLGYCLIRFGCDAWWRSVSPYWGYAFEVAFVLLAIILFKIRPGREIKASQEITLSLLPAWVAGYTVHSLLAYSGVRVPFVFKSIELVLLLLVVAPILEEFVFRLALWEPLRRLRDQAAFILVSTSLLFSVGHLIALASVPLAYKPFVLIQTLYVILLGLACGSRRLATGSVWSAITVHFGFNLGFYCFWIFKS